MRGKQPAENRPAPNVSRGLALCAIKAASLLILGCSAPAASGESEKLLEASFRHLFTHNASALQQAAPVFCVGLGAGSHLANPPPVVITALQDVEPDVRPASDCGHSDIAYEISSGKRAVIFHVSDIDCQRGDRCSFMGGYYEANLSASRSGYLAVRQGGEWAVSLDPDVPSAIS